MPTTIHPFPELRAYAEREARDIWTRHVRLFREAGDCEFVESPDLFPEGFAVTVEAQVERLCDLTRDASRDAVCRLVAEKVGLPRESGAPTLFFYDGSRHRGALRGWHMYATNRHGRYAQHRFCTDAENAIDAATSHPVYPETHVPGICDVTDPAEALSMIVTHLWPPE